MLNDKKEQKKVFLKMRLAATVAIFMTCLFLYFLNNYSNTKNSSHSKSLSLPYFNEHLVNIPVSSLTKTIINSPEATQAINSKILTYWAQWCEPCKTEIASLKNLAHQVPRIRFYLINLDEDENNRLNAKKWINSMAWEANIETLFLSQIDIENALKQLSGVPTSDLIVNNATIKYRFEGSVQWDHPTVKAQVLETLGE